MLRLPRRPARIVKLAGTIAQGVRTEVSRASVSVTIGKPVALDHGEPGVPLRRAPESCYENRVFRPAWLDRRQRAGSVPAWAYATLRAGKAPSRMRGTALRADPGGDRDDERYGTRRRDRTMHCHQESLADGR